MENKRKEKKRKEKKRKEKDKLRKYSMLEIQCCTFTKVLL